MPAAVLSPLPPALPPGAPVPLPSFAGTSARRSPVLLDVLLGALEVDARVAVSATIAGLAGVPARQSLFWRRTSAMAAAIVIACASDDVGTRSTAPLFSALMLSR